jgi:hypothetical protein
MAAVMVAVITVMFDPGDGGSTFIQNFGMQPEAHMAQQPAKPRKPNSHRHENLKSYFL